MAAKTQAERGSMAGSGGPRGGAGFRREVASMRKRLGRLPTRLLVKQGDDGLRLPPKRRLLQRQALRHDVAVWQRVRGAAPPSQVARAHQQRLRSKASGAEAVSML